jgi:hypothetical protein
MKCLIGWSKDRRLVYILNDWCDSEMGSNSRFSIVQPCIKIHEGRVENDGRFVFLHRLVALKRDYKPREWRSLRDPIYGHMARHYLKMKYMRKKQGIYVPFFAPREIINLP